MKRIITSILALLLTAAMLPGCAQEAVPETPTEPEPDESMLWETMPQLTYGVMEYEKLRILLAYLKENGVEVKTVSGGSTGTAQIKAAEGLYTELQAGSYLFMDATYRTLDLPFRNSLFVLTTVVSRRDGLTVVDAGVKTCGVDQGVPAPEKGSVREIVASEEHFQLHGYSETVAVGSQIRLIPGHCCSTVNLHDKIYLVDGDKVIDRIPVTARGIGR